MDNLTHFPVYAVFIGSNFAMAIFLYFRTLTSLIHQALRSMVMILLIFSAILSIISSDTLIKNGELAKISIVLLLISYILLLLVIILGIYSESDEHNVQRIMSEHGVRR